MRLGAALVGLGLALAGPTAAAAAPLWSVVAENDNFNFWQPPDQRPDVGYTHGTEIEARAGAPGALRRLPSWLLGAGDAAPEPSLDLRLRQLIYTPWFTDGADQPFAGWLELALVASRASATGARTLAFHLGVTGPAAQADRMQRWFHRQFGLGPAPPWTHELPTEPGLGFEWSGLETARGWGPRTGFAALVGPEWRLRAATDALDARLGADATFGWAPPDPSRTPRGPVSVYLVGALRMDVVVRSEFLDGTLFRPSERTHAEPLVPEAESGVGVRLLRLRGEWRIHRRAPDFEGQPAFHTYSTLALEWD